MAENYVTNQYSFESRESYEQTKKEAEQIKKLIHSADLKNPKILLCQKIAYQLSHTLFIIYD